MKKMLDLFSGLGGASEAFLNNGWEVLRIENNPLLKMVPNTKLMSVEGFKEWYEENCHHAGDRIKLVWASPPCTDFSTGYSSPRSIAERNGEDYYPHDAIELVEKTKELIDLINPQYYIIENVRGAIKYLKPILGEPTMIIDSIVLWGRFPTWAMPPNYQHIKSDVWSSDPLRANIRAKIPYEISDACRQSIESQRTLCYWF